MKKEYLVILGVGGFAAIGTGVGQSLWGGLIGFGFGCVLSVISLVLFDD
jgi:hypothetical protein